MGHTPPGVDDRESGASVLNERHNAKYLQLIRLYSDIIRGQFFGHWHTDTFRVVYNDNGRWTHLSVCPFLRWPIRAAVGADGSMRREQRCSTLRDLRFTKWLDSFLSLSLSPARIYMIFTFVHTFCRFDFLLQVDKVTFHFFNAKIEILDIVVTFFPVKVQRLLLSSYFAFVARVSKNAPLLNRFNDESAIRVS